MVTTLLVTLGVSLGINIIMFLLAYKLKSDKLTDASYAITFIVIALLTNFQSTHNDTYRYTLIAMVCVWAVRIGSFLLYRVIEKGRDRRFDGMRENFGKFARFWIGQAITVWVLLLPLILSTTHTANIGTLQIIGVLIWFVGLLIESAADLQKFMFTHNPENKNTWIDEGLWSYSRHPNYFGEILVWIGIYVFALTILQGPAKFIGLISPIFITILLTTISGIPILEKSADAKWGKQAAYQAYKKRTSVLIPLPHDDESSSR